MAERQFEISWVDPWRWAILHLPFGAVGAVVHLLSITLNGDSFSWGRLLLILFGGSLGAVVVGWIYAHFLNLAMTLLERGSIIKADELVPGSDGGYRRTRWDR